MKNFEILLVLLFCIGVSYAANSNTYSTIEGQYGTCSDASGNIYVTSTTTNIIYQIDPESLVPIIYAGTGVKGYKDGNAYSTAQFNTPKGITINPSTNDLYVADYANNAIRKISGGVVSTVASDLFGPINVALVRDGRQTKVNPIGIYVTQENGQIVYLTEGPANDDCKGAISLGALSKTPILTYGSTVKATADPSALCKSQSPTDGVWYSFTGNGNTANITTCNTGTSSNARLFVFRDSSPHDNSCDDLYCMLNQNNTLSMCPFTFYATSTALICTQPNTVYYVVVDAEGYNEGQFELRISDMGVTSQCSSCTCDGVECGANSCGGYCAEDCTGGAQCIDQKCVPDAPNGDCTGAIALAGNTTISADTRTSFTLDNFAQAGVCSNIYYTGLWYKFVGTGTTVTINTCSTQTNFPTYLHVYEAGAEIPCSVGLYCVEFSYYYYCGPREVSASNIEFCSQKGVTYYYYVEGPNYQKGNFELTQTVGTASC